MVRDREAELAQKKEEIQLKTDALM